MDAFFLFVKKLAIELMMSIGGVLELSGGTYKCIGFVSKWTKCHFYTRDPPREGGNDWNIPEGVMSNFIKEWAKKYQGKNKRPKREHVSARKIFLDMTIAFAGRMSWPQISLKILKRQRQE
eukprot:TRINITY_DN12469_c0_g1_i4.p1 TRINITY_DN12469_c0_g1~~TRINITY_DN12469_c0_g1_i4.p1  ORF type:complete len:121 (-),score=23.67 TRINITY_DN12469_c0_g1_i4:138-500(-)